LPVPRTGKQASFLLGAEREFCCAGCEAVAQAIVAGGFERYYETRRQPAKRGQDPFSPGEEYLPVQAPGGASEAALILGRVTCAACLWLIEQVLARTPGVLRADVNYATERAQVAWDPDRTSLGRIVAAIRAVGYDAVPYDPQRQEAARRSARRDALWRLFVAGFGAMQVMMYAFPEYVGEGELSPEASQAMRWASLLITLPVLAFACRPFFAGAWRELRTLRIGLETPIALGLAGAFLASAWATFTGEGEVYFDSIGMLAFLLLGARYVESAVRGRAAAGLDRLLQWQPARHLKPGDLACVAPGERFPADGMVEQGASSADESLLTGEARAVAKRAGDAVVAGAVNLEQPLVVRVTRAGADTRSAAIARLAERAAASRPALVEAADRVAAHLTRVVVVAAVAAGLFWGDPWIAVAVLVATCPCALALAAPIVLTRANAALLSAGVLVTRSRAYEALSRATDMVLDKTGTLTFGRVGVSRVALLGEADEAHCLAIAAALEATSRHPVANAFRLGSPDKADNVSHFPGEGIEGVVAGQRYRIGAQRFCQALCGTPAPRRSNVYLAAERGWLAGFELSDRLRPDAAALVAELRRRGIEVHLASGDEPAAVSAIARELGIARWHAAMSPQAKHDYVAALQAQGRVVAMAGDGLNDAPVLARADASLAMASGADAAQLHADIVVTGDRLAAIGEALAVAKRAMRLVRQGFAWALAYNAAVLPLAMAGWIGPWQAALGMGLSSLAVMLNASRPLAPRAKASPWKASISSSPSPSPSSS
jgi:Cu2+-exporting ATPase